MATPWGKSGTAEQLRKADPNKLDALHLDGLVVLKIIKHAHENWPDEVNGSLLGLDIGTILEVTNSFPYPQPVETEDGNLLEGQMEADEYQMEMMKMLREVNVDNNCVGWYKSMHLGSFCQTPLIETQFAYQETLSDNCVVLLYDPIQTAHGNLTLKARRARGAHRCVSRASCPGSRALRRLFARARARRPTASRTISSRRFARRNWISRRRRRRSSSSCP